MLNSFFKKWSYRIFAPGTLLRENYEALKRLLAYDIQCHEQMAEFQELLHGGQREDLIAIRRRFETFSENVLGMVTSLECIAPGKYSSLKNYHKKFDFYTRFFLEPPKQKCTPPFILQFEDIDSENKEVGNKAKHLALLSRDLKLPVPKAFVLTVSSFHYLLAFNNLRGTVDALLADLNIHDMGSLSSTSIKLMALIRGATVPSDIEGDLLLAYDQVMTSTGSEVAVAVRSSAICEDGESSFAGQYATLINVKKHEMCSAYLEVLASKYSPEALFYRVSQGLGDEETAMAVLIQEMVYADCSGVIYTSQVVSGSQGMSGLSVHAVRGFGHRLVGGEEIPETYRVNGPGGGVGLPDGGNTLLAPGKVKNLSELAFVIERFFGVPQDIEWAINEAGEPRILQARELHILEEIADRTPLYENPEALLFDGCECGSPGVAYGRVYRVDEFHPVEDVPEGAVLVTADSPPEYVKIIHRLSAVISRRGSKASHFATVAREFGIPYLAGVEKSTSLTAKKSVTVDGDRGAVYEGREKALLERPQLKRTSPYALILTEALKFISPLELVDPEGENFTPEGCRSMHDIIRFCHEKALHEIFSTGRPGTGRGAQKLTADLPLDVFLFDVGGGVESTSEQKEQVALSEILSIPFQALWRGMSHPDVQWKQKPFDWEAYDKILLSGGVPPKKESFSFASFAVIGPDYLHFNLRFGYHFTIIDVLCGNQSAENHCMLRFAGGGGDYDHRLRRIDFIAAVLNRLEFMVEKKGDLLEARLSHLTLGIIEKKLDMLGRLLGASKLMDMVLEDSTMVANCVDDFFSGRYSFSQEG